MKTNRRLFGLLLCGAMLFTLCFQPVFAQGQVQDSGGTEKSALAGAQAMGAANRMTGTLTIGDQMVTGNSDVLGNGSVLYDEVSNTITLTNCSLPTDKITYTDDLSGTLTIKLVGENSLSRIKVDGNLEIMGDGSLVLEPEDKDYTCIESINGSITITGGASITATTGDYSSGIYADSGSVIVDGSTVVANSVYPGLTATGGVIIRNNSDVTSISSGTTGIYTQGKIEISSSKVTASSTAEIEGYYYSALQGDQGVTITGCTGDNKVVLSSSSSNGIYTPDKIIIGNSNVSAHGHFVGLYGTQGVQVSGGSDVEATGDYGAGINSTSIQISESQVVATGLYCGLDQRQELEGHSCDGSVIIQDGSKVTATATIPDAGMGISAGGNFGVTDSAVYADGDLYGICVSELCDVSGSWVDAGKDIGANEYRRNNSVIIYDGQAVVTGNASVPEDVVLPAGLTFSIGTTCSLKFGELKVVGDLDGSTAITVNAQGDLVLPEGTIVSQPDGTLQIVDKGGTTLAPDGTVTNLLYYVTVEYGEGGTASSSAPDELAKPGTTVTLTATPDTGYHFKEWQVERGGMEIRDNSFTMPATNVIVKAIFEQDVHSVTVQTEGEGTASASPANAEEGEKITLTAAAAEGWHFKEWQVISGGVTVSNGSFTMPDAHVTVKAIFEQDTPQPAQYSVTVQIEGKGTASASPVSAAQGEKITLTAVAEDGWHFKEWQVISGGVTVSNGSFTMPAADVTVKAVFEQNRSGSGSTSGGSSSDRASSALSYGRERLTDGGVTLSGSAVREDARLTVVEDRLHGEDCDTCGQIRRWQAQGRVIAVYDVSMSRGFRGTVTLTFPVPDEYNGETLQVAHCLKKRLDTYDVTVSNGKVSVTVDSLSPFVILKDTGLPLDGEEPDAVLTETEEKTENPATGEKGKGIWPFGLCALLAAGVLAAMDKRRGKRTA